jgi:diguanylate cyclase (GGDEF)-like protein
MLAVMFVDLDKFKHINDTYGHAAGDVVLQTVALRLAHTTRNDDTVSRYGGDEFLCLLTPLHEQKDIAIIAAKVRAAIQAPCAVRVGDATINLCVAASIGISVFPQDGDSAACLIARADDAMYAAKQHPSGVAFAPEKVGESATPHGEAGGGRLTFEDGAAARLFDIES